MENKKNNLLNDLMNWFAKLGQVGISENQQESNKTNTEEMPTFFTTSGSIPFDHDGEPYEVLEHEEEYDSERDKIIGHLLLRSQGKIKKIFLESDRIESFMVKKANMVMVKEEHVSL